MGDVGRATEFFNLVEISEWGMPDFDVSEVEEEWADLELEKSVVLVEDETGQIVASMTLVLSNGLTWEAFGYVHPEHQQRGLGSWAIRWSEAWAREREEETKPDYRLDMLNYISAINRPAQDLLAAEGYEVAKVFRRMRIDLEERPAAVSWPKGYTTPPFEEARDKHAYFDAIQTAFAEHWSASPRTFESWAKQWLAEGYDPDLLVQLVHDDLIVGTCCGKKIGDGGWIGYVAVIPEFRRRGLAKLLLQESFGRFWDKGIKQVDLGVDSENRQSAIDLYLGMGMHESHSYETNRKVLREGLDWRDDEEDD
jgi:ribosomal protein S18 acetylase RimI-like enzyme